MKLEMNESMDKLQNTRLEIIRGRSESTNVSSKKHDVQTKFMKRNSSFGNYTEFLIPMAEAESPQRSETDPEQTKEPQTVI